MSGSQKGMVELKYEYTFVDVQSRGVTIEGSTYWFQDYEVINLDEQKQIIYVTLIAAERKGLMSQYTKDKKLFHFHWDKPLLNTYWNYFKYVLRHKKFVFIECWAKGLYIQAVTHDLSKFLPSEFKPYALKFYGGDYAYKIFEVEENFDRAWLRHQNRNPHHWKYWVTSISNCSNTIQDRTVLTTYFNGIPLEMPLKYVIEMICDWRGAGMAIHGRNEVVEWYHKNKKSMLLHPNTRTVVNVHVSTWITK